MEKTLPVDQRRAFEMALDIAATPDEVWRALTQAEELVRWFPMEARVTPGVGGTMLWNWGEGQDWESRIDVWEPGRRLRLVQDDARPYDTQGRALPAGMSEPARIAMEFTLETHRGKTRLRLVHSGFGEGAAWDTEIEGISEGWQAELRSLRHYLERHRGQDRYPGRAMLSTSMPREAAWDRLLGPDGFRGDPVQPEGRRRLHRDDSGRPAFQRHRAASPAAADARRHGSGAGRRLVPSAHLARCDRGDRGLGLGLDLWRSARSGGPVPGGCPGGAGADVRVTLSLRSLRMTGATRSPQTPPS